MSTEKDYVLGTHDAELGRLGLQHNVWRPHAHAAWHRAGFNVGQTILDVGCGPGYATLDLADLVGPSGRVTAVDRSRRFLDSLEARRDARGIEHVSVVEDDLDHVTFEPARAHGAWCRWVLAFVMRPRELVARIADALAPGGAFVSHEYFDYGTWRSLPPSPLLEEFVTATIDNWRASGGEPNIGPRVPRWLEDLGFEIESVRPLIFVVDPNDFMWRWPTSYLEVGLERFVELGVLDEARAATIRAGIKELSSGARMITPGVLEVIARKSS
jgi:SAM-dependent methyltransferase